MLLPPTHAHTHGVHTNVIALSRALAYHFRSRTLLCTMCACTSPLHILTSRAQDLALFSAEAAAASGAVASATYGNDSTSKDRERTLEKGIARMKLRAISADDLLSLDLDDNPTGGADGNYDNMSSMQSSDNIEVFGFGALSDDEDDENDGPDG